MNFTCLTLKNVYCCWGLVSLMFFYLIKNSLINELRILLSITHNYYLFSVTLLLFIYIYIVYWTTKIRLLKIFDPMTWCTKKKLSVIKLHTTQVPFSVLSRTFYYALHNMQQLYYYTKKINFCIYPK